MSLLEKQLLTAKKSVKNGDILNTKIILQDILSVFPQNIRVKNFLNSLPSNTSPENNQKDDCDNKTSQTHSESVAVNEIIFLAEEAASCELWGLLKRPDEKFVTEKAYDNPKFVEDLVRDVAISLEKFVSKKRINGYSIESENFESIHNHSAFAQIEKRKFNLSTT